MAFGLAEVVRLAVRIDMEGNASKGISNLTKQVGSLDRGLGRAARGAGKLSAGFTKAGVRVGAAVVGGFTAAAAAAIDFEDAFAGVKKTVNESELIAAGTSFAKLEEQFRGFAKEIPIAATDFARLGETAGALGVAAGDIDEFVKTTALMGVTTNLSADEAADAFGRIGTILNLTGDDYQELADSIVALGNSGASTESEITEITKRFAAEGKAAGLAKEEMVGLASVTASLGFAPERGGTALSRVFANMGTNIALANKKGKAFSKLVGEPIKDLQKKLDQGEGLSIFLDVLEEIKGLSPTEANRTLKALGITNTSDRTIFRTMSQNLPEVTRQLNVAQNATGALGKEAEKRFSTVASKIAVFKNNLIDAGISIGEGMIPAIGRATEKLTKFLQEPGNVKDLQNLGKEIGEAIDGIDWDEVIKGGKSLVGVMKSAFDWAKRLFDLFNSLPTEFKGLLVGGLAVNKLSGGLVGSGLGDILGGAVKSALSTLPIFGKAFVQPVFVTNMPLGGIGGIPGGVAAGVGLGAAATAGAIGVGAVAGGAAAVVITRPAVDIINPKFNQRIDAGERPLGNRDPRRFDKNGRVVAEFEGDVKGAIKQTATHTALISPGLNAIKSAVGGVMAVQQATRNATMNAASIASRENAANGQRIDAVNRAIVVSQAANSLMMSVQAAGQAIRDATQTAATKTAGTTTANASRSAGSTVASATNSSASRIVSAIYAARPIINVTTVNRFTTTNNRYGPTGGSSNTQRIPAGVH